MRITIGHVLMTVIVGGAVAYGVAKPDVGDWFQSRVQGVRDMVSSYVGFMKSGDLKTPAVPPDEVPVEPEPVEVPPNEPVAPAPVAVVTPEPAAPPAPAVKSKPKKARKKSPPKKKPAARSAAKKPAVETPAPAASPAANAPAQDLIGAYVSIKLNTGRSVKGILEERTAAAYVVQLPGLGTFVYPVENVESVSLAE